MHFLKIYFLGTINLNSRKNDTYGKESKKEYIYIYIIYITESLCCIPEASTTL